ncbi:MAG TPA: lyase family protein [Paracoccaceae bacterium]|nr:lyase family protein [Paracoccaceae bacterium]
MTGTGELYSALFGDEGTAAHLSDAAEVAAMARVEAALARAQADTGVIPPEAAEAIARVCTGFRPDMAALAAATGRNGVPVPGLVEALRAAGVAAGEEEAMRWLHWGATSQDIMDTALALRLRAMFDLWDGRLAALLALLGEQAERHADLPMVARTYGQAAVPTSFGVVATGWGRPVMRQRSRLAALRADVLKVSLSGAAGTLAAMGPRGPEVRARLAALLGLEDPATSWHSERDGIGALAAWMAGTTTQLGRMGEDLAVMAQTGFGEVAIAGAGASSTMPQKQNPVGPSALVALARQAGALAAAVQGAGLHRQARDGAAWFTEWLCLPPLALACGRALSLACDVAVAVRPDAAAMARGLAADGGLILAERLTFRLATSMPRDRAAAAVKALCARVRAGEGSLPDLAAAAFPGLGALIPDLGTAPDEARAFPAMVRALD